MLRGRNWARWLCAAWLAAHIVIAGLHTLEQLLIHAVLFVVISFLLFRPRASAYFRPAPVENSQ
jgi:hypothetical protein